MSDKFTQLLARVESKILGPDGRPLWLTAPVVWDEDCPRDKLFFVKQNKDPKKSPLEVVGVITDVAR